MNTAVALMVIGRSESHCEACGIPLADGEGQLHHRLLRSRGGKDEAANLVRLCQPCHQHAHENPTLSMANGLMVGSWERTTKKFRTPNGWAQFSDDGSTIFLDENPVLF